MPLVSRPMRARIIAVVSGAFVLAGIGISAPLASASATPATRTSGTNSATRGGLNNGSAAVTHRVDTPEGTLVYGWRPFTAVEAQAARQGSRVKPISATGCSEEVCISISGDGLYVDEWKTWALYGGGYVCTRSRWYHPYSAQIRYGNSVCGGAGVFFSDWYPRKNFTRGIVCNTWDYIIGKPCEYITP